MAEKNLMNMTSEEYTATWDAMVRAENIRAEKERREHPERFQRPLTGFRLLPSEHVR